jgi:hypothetical protein
MRASPDARAEIKRFNAGLLPKLPGGGLLGSLTGRHGSSGHDPHVSLAGVQSEQQDPVARVDEEHARGGAKNRAILVHARAF